MSTTFQRALRHFVETLANRIATPVIGVLLNPVRREVWLLVLLAIYVAVWATYCTISTATQEMHVDMTEAAVLGRDLSFGYPKHPPLSAWLPGLWFRVFPTAPWAYYILSITIAAVGLWACWRLAALWLTPEKQILALALLTFVPFYNFHALRFNANTILIPLWGLTTLWFARSLLTRSPFYAALAGLAAAGAVLGKYWSIFLLAALAFATLFDQRRSSYFRSAAPWITAGMGALALAPHVQWLFMHGFATFDYATRLHGARSLPVVAIGALRYFTGAAAFAALPTILALAATRPMLAELPSVLFPRVPERRWPALAFWGGLLLPVPVAFAAGIRLTDLWAMPAFALLPVVLLSSPRLMPSPRAFTHIVAAAVFFPFVMLAVSPLIAVAAGWREPAPHDHRALAAAVGSGWREMTSAPLRIIAGSHEIAYGAAFYADGKPSAFPYLQFQWAPFLTEARLKQDGLAAICELRDLSCLTAARSRSTGVNGSREWEVAVAGGSAIKQLPATRYLIITIPPSGP